MSEEDRLVHCFARVFPNLSDTEIKQASMTRLGAWDSAALLRLLSGVEREFEVRFDQDQINAFTSFLAILDALRDMTYQAGRRRD